MRAVAAIVGPTAVGKSSAALEVAEAVGGEIVSVDSMQVYSGMDIGTDKATPEMQARVPHHLLDLWPPSYDVTVAEFQAAARAAIEDVGGRGRLPVLVGGSGLYFRAVVDELEFPPRSPEVRAALETEAETAGAEKLYLRLEQLDPDAAARMEPTNARRIVRALEVIELTGRPFSENDAWDRYESRYDLAVAGLTRPRDDLYRRVEARVERMLERGLVAETEALARAGMGRTARQALGYRQVIELSPEHPSLKDEIVKATKRFARRQESWFRADPRVTWFECDPEPPQDEIVAFLRGRLG